MHKDVERTKDGPPNYSLWAWFCQFFTGRPHVIIGSSANPYMLRWYLLPRNHRINIYLHKFMRDDDDRALHDHPWWFASFMLKGKYIEWMPMPYTVLGQTVIEPQTRTAGSLAFRSAEHRHCVKLPRREDGSPIPCWTLVMTGPKTRLWGFHCPKGFVPWYEFGRYGDTGDEGAGCGD